MDETNINYLLSAMVQSGAALVAIVGGLLGARYVSLHSEVRAADSEVARREASFELLKLEVEHGEDEENLLKARAFLFRSDVLSALAKQSPLEPIRDKAREVWGNHKVFHTISEQLMRLQSEMNAAREQIRRTAGEDDYRTRNWVTFRLKKVLPVSDDLVWLAVYRQLCLDRHSPPSHVSEANDKFLHAGSEERLTKQRSDLEVQDLKMMQTAYRYDHAYSLVDEAKRYRASLTAGEGFGLALEVLALIAVATIAVPLFAMVPDAYDYVPASRWLFVCLFVLGVAVLFWYFFVYSQYLRDRRSSMPAHVWGLFDLRSTSAKVTASVASSDAAANA